MAGQLFEFDPPDRFVAGTVGEPGERTFFLQASGGGRLVSVALEKVQVQALAEKLDELLDEVRRRQGEQSVVPPSSTREMEDVAPLDAPIEEEFRVGTLALAWDGETSSILVEAQSVGPEGEVEPPEGTQFTGDMLRVRLSPVAARAFARRAQRVVAAGRPPCPLCGNPLDPQGHICPRQNGHRPSR
jgi:uncharacterized repeat protein (TIGR03847 family)